MTEQHTPAGDIPALTLGWRLKMALGDMTAIEMADALGVNRGTVSRWMSDTGAPPKRAYTGQWAMITRTNRDWLEQGIIPSTGPTDGPGAEVGEEGLEPPTFRVEDRPLALVEDIAA